MISISRDWWEHLAPKVMHRRLREVEGLLREWSRSDYGSFWLRTAMQEHGVIRVKPGQFIPVVHLIALADRPIYIAPQQRVRLGHRMVGPDQFRSGHTLEAGELALGPEIRLDVVQDRALLAAAARLDMSPHVSGVKDPSQIFSTPARFLIAPKEWPKKSFVLYQHIFGEGSSYPNDGFFYVGVTTRGWQKRWSEHRRAMEAGSLLLFHRKLREELSQGRVTYIHHKVMGITDDLEQLYATEEWLVEGHWSDTRRLNMIPGGKSGLRYLRENGMLAERVAPMPDDRERLVQTWLREHPRKGLPAPWVSERWKDDAWAVAQICGRDDRLSVEQVRAIRELAIDHPTETIAVRIGARSKEQVQRVIDGETYTRVL
ncbi:hypothetical protein PY365_27105 [Roseiarcaceae bacterium H3SJ34-1]|uniref:hypothetical protein n=1 Tax=Terripilifer ovatus TaxID=3032367 RepID=UPI003AB948DF|nr:hypothetical protein [Roseiarcaceae bacterium H3SJ34-1]